MDKDTRFLLASEVSENRDANGAIAAFQEAIKNANGNLPNTIKTDAHHSYKEGISKTFDAANTDHIARCEVNKPHANNNRIERLNGTLRERVKCRKVGSQRKAKLPKVREYITIL